MLARFALEPAALNLSSLSAPVSCSLSRQFVRQWQRCGVLIIPALPDGRSEIYNVVRQLPQNMASLWRTAFTNGAKHGIMRSFSRPVQASVREFSGPADAAALAGLVDVIFVSTNSAGVLG